MVRPSLRVSRLVLFALALAAPCALAGDAARPDPDAALPALSPRESHALARSWAALRPLAQADGSTRTDLDGTFREFLVLSYDEDGAPVIRCLNDEQAVRRALASANPPAPVWRRAAMASTPAPTSDAAPLAPRFAAPSAAALAHGATITLVNEDAPNVGLNDTHFAMPVGGNTAQTVGGQRWNVFRRAADLWAAALPPGIAIRIGVRFTPLTCTPTSGILGEAGPTEMVRDFPRAPYAATLYAKALANHLLGRDVDTTQVDIEAEFNLSIGTTSCETTGWYYGLEGSPGAQLFLLPVVLHELGHGLGFLSATGGGETPPYFAVFDHFLLDETTGRLWTDESEAERMASAVACTQLVWDGPAVRAAAPARLWHAPLLRLAGPAAVRGDWGDPDVGGAEYGPPLDATGVAAALVALPDSAGALGTGCGPITSELAGRIALLDVGACSTRTKIENAQRAGAIGAIVIAPAVSCPTSGLVGRDTSVHIPALLVSAPLGALLHAHVAEGITAMLTVDARRLSGCDASGRVRLFTPTQLMPGSTVSHWDTGPAPTLLMNAIYSPQLVADVDLTAPAFADMGWFGGRPAAPAGTQPDRLEVLAPNPSRGTTLLAFSLRDGANVELSVFDLLGRRVATLPGGWLAAGRHALRWDGRDANGRALHAGVYRVRLRTANGDEVRSLVLAP